MSEPPVHTRATDEDSPEVASRIASARRSGRRWTIFYSAVVAGAVAIFFGYANDKSQVQRSQDNCNAIQEDRLERVKELRRDAKRLDDEADFVLGDPTENPPVQPFDFEASGFENLKLLSIQEAKKSRREANRDREEALRIKNRVENCEKVFPDPDLWPL